MSAKLCKLFVGGLNVETTEDGLRAHFEQFGALSDCVVVQNQTLGRSRCFGFITYSAPEEADAAMAAKPHVVDGKTVELKMAIAREDANNPDIVANVKKIFVGGVKDHIEAENLTEYFCQFGAVEKAEIISDKQTGRKRGFGFVFFEDNDSATKAVLTKYHTINGNKFTPMFYCAFIKVFNVWKNPSLAVLLQVLWVTFFLSLFFLSLSRW
uniref:RRM domain-containing protein n=1 Tax=Labrus bergylta TaxID=56723 RepID=A0A3Q3LHR9_9LABR